MIEQVTSPQASPEPAPSPSGSEAPPAAAASQATPSTPPGSQPTTPPARPEWAPETLWDAEKGELVADKLGEEFKRLSTFEAEEKARREALPKSVDDYETAFSDDVQLPDGWKINPDDPLWKAGKEFAAKNGLTQEQFKELASMKARELVAQQAFVQEMVAKRDAELGAGGPERVEALRKFFDGAFDKETAAELKAGMVTARQIKALETMQKLLVDQGVTEFSALGRTDTSSANGGYPENFDQLPFSKQMELHRKLRAASAN